MKLKFSGLLLFSTGFFVSANLSLNPASENAVRALDLVFVVFGLMLVRDILSRKFPLDGWILATSLIAAIITLSGLAVINADAGQAPTVVRFFGGLLVGGAAARYIHEKDAYRPFALGIVCGCAALVLITYLQILGHPFALSLRPPLVIDNTYEGNLRASGLSSHPNPNMIVIVVSASYIFLFARNHRLYPLIVFWLLVGFAYVGTQTRAGLVAALIVSVVFLMERTSGLTKAASIVIVAVAAILFAPHLDDLLGGRISGIAGDGMTIFDQAYERFSTTMVGAFVAMSHPFGIATTVRDELLYSQFGLHATHNGFVFMALKFGPLIAAGLLSMMFWTLFSSMRRPGKYPYHIVLIAM